MHHNTYMQRVWGKFGNLVPEPVKSVTCTQANMKFGFKNSSDTISQPPQTQGQGYVGAIFSFHVQTLLAKADQLCPPFVCYTDWNVTINWQPCQDLVWYCTI